MRSTGLALVFVNVLLERAGLPLPATPTLLVCGALAATGRLSAWSIFALALLACVIGDTLWYAAGRYYGRQVMSVSLPRLAVAGLLRTHH